MDRRYWGHERHVQAGVAAEGLLGVAAVVFALPVIGTLVEGPYDATSFGFLLICAAFVSWMVRSLFIRVVANESGVRVVGLLSDRTYPWESIASVEGPPQSKYVVLVTNAGERRRLPGLRQSLVEQVPPTPEPSSGSAKEQDLSAWSRTASSHRSRAQDRAMIPVQAAWRCSRLGHMHD